MSRYFWPIFTPPPPCQLCHTSRDTPQKYVRHLGPPTPIFSRPSTKTRTKAPSTNSLSIVRGVFVRRVFSGGL